MSLLQRTSGLYENLKQSNINLVKFENASIQLLQKNISHLFSLLDRGDNIQNEISLRLWILRSTIIFTLLPFSDERLCLSSQIEELQILADGFPQMIGSIEVIKTVLLDLHKITINPKREWLLNSVTENNKSGDKSIGLLSNLSFNRSLSSSSETMKELVLLKDNVYFINSLQDLKNNTFENIVLPCGCKNTPLRMLHEIFYSGRGRQFDVLLYSGESFNIPKRLSLPVSNAISARFEKTKFEKIITDINESSPIEIIDDWINNSFWNEIHGENRSGAENLIPAHYVLFKNGTGTFIPQDGRVQTLYENSTYQFSEGDLKSIPANKLDEGDLVIIRVGQSGFLLDTATESIMLKTGTHNLYEEATQWKFSLEALLLTHTLEDVAHELHARGVSVPTSSIQRWVGYEGIGPRNEKDFNELLRLLIEKGKIDLTSETIEQYSRRVWNSLQSLRGLRQKAGNEIRQELFKALSKKLSDKNGPLADKTSINTGVEDSAELQILRVFQVDKKLSYVAPSRIGRVDDLRSNKWLG